MTIVVATTNAHKLSEIRYILNKLPYTIESIKKYSKIEEPEETGDTFAANARLKALYYSSDISQLTVAEDSGLEIDRLDGAPGIHSARYPGATYQEKVQADLCTTSSTRFQHKSCSLRLRNCACSKSKDYLRVPECHRRTNHRTSGWHRGFWVRPNLLLPAI